MEGSEGAVRSLSRESPLEQTGQELPSTSTSASNESSSYPPLPPSECSTDDEGEVSNGVDEGEEQLGTGEGVVAPVQVGSMDARSNDALVASLPPSSTSPTSSQISQQDVNEALKEEESSEEEVQSGECEGERLGGDASVEDSGVAVQEEDQASLEIADQGRYQRSHQSATILLTKFLIKSRTHCSLSNLPRRNQHELITSRRSFPSRISSISTYLSIDINSHGRARIKLWGKYG